MTACFRVFSAWDDSLKEFTNVAREVTRKRTEKFIPIKVEQRHEPLRERVKYFRDFRKMHEQLRVMVGPLSEGRRLTASTTEGGKEASGIGEIDMEHEVSLSPEHDKSATADPTSNAEQVKLAYESIKAVDVLDVSPRSCRRPFSFLLGLPVMTTTEGTDLWVSAEAAYTDRVARVENQLIARLRDRLQKAKQAQEMFRVFSRFNALFVRPKIRGESDGSASK